MNEKRQFSRSEILCKLKFIFSFEGHFSSPCISTIIIYVISMFIIILLTRVSHGMGFELICGYYCLRLKNKRKEKVLIKI